MSRNPAPGESTHRGRRPHRVFPWLCLFALAAPLALAEPEDPPTVDQLLQALESPDFGDRVRAMDGLAAHRDASEAHAPALRERLRDPDPATRQRAAMALAALGVGEPAVLEELLAGMGRRIRGRYLSQPDPALGSMTALVKLGAPAVPSLIKAMEDGAYASRDWAMEALGRIGPAAREAVPALLRQLETENVATRCAALTAKWRIDGDAAFTRAQAIPLLEVEAGRECNGAVYTLALLGPEAVPAMPALIAALRRHHSGGILDTLADLAPHAREVVLPALRETLDDPVLTDNAAIHLQNLGEPSGPLIRRQLQRLRASAPGDGTDPMRIVYTIVIHGPEAKIALDELVALLQHENAAVRQAAAWGLPRIFAEETPVTTALEQALRDPAAAEEAARSLAMMRAAKL